MIKWIKQLFCKHEYEKKTIPAFVVVDGLLVQPSLYRCKKCGKCKFLNIGCFDDGR